MLLIGYIDQIEANVNSNNALQAAREFVLSFDQEMKLEEIANLEDQELAKQQIEVISKKYFHSNCTGKYRGNIGGMCKINNNLEQPWMMCELNSKTYKAPCRSYSKKSISLLDDKYSRYSIELSQNIDKLCANPRFIVELLAGNYYYSIMQQSHVRVYRITARGFGKNGNTTSILQQIIGIKGDKIIFTAHNNHLSVS